MPDSWRVGHGAATIAVPDGVALAGYVARQGVSDGVLDPLEVQAIAFRDPGGAVAVICVADLLQVDDDLATAARAAVAAGVGTDPSLVWLSATHTHAGPEPGLVAELVVAAATRAATEATCTASPARLTRHRGELSGVGGQRTGASRRTTVPVDVVRVADPQGGLRGLVGVVPVHPTVLSAANLRLSADLVGGVRRGVADRAGAWSVVLTGAAGDVSTRPHRREQTSAEVDRLGSLTADLLVEVAATPALGEASGPLAGDVAVVPLDAADPGAAFRHQALDEARRSLAAAEESGDPGRIRDAQVTLQGAELGAGLGAGSGPGTAQGPVPAAVAALDLGGIRLVGLGGEPFLALADDAAAAEPSAVLAGYANGYCGYLPTRDAFARAEEQPEYEVLIARAGAGGAERALAAARALLHSGRPPQTVL